MSQDHDMETRVFQVVEAGVRLDKFLVEKCPDLSRSHIQGLIREAHVLVNDHRVRPALKLRQGDNITVTISAHQAAVLLPEDIPIQIIYEDADIIIINKPAGLIIYPAPGHASHTLVNALLMKFPDLETFGSSLRPGIVHRLDKDTSGLMVIARNEGARQYLVEQFKTRSIKKGYLVLVRGKLAPENGAIDAPIGRNPANRKRMAVVSGGREAKTSYKVRQYIDGYTLLEAWIETGRTHQIRVHFAAIGNPVIGDSIYGVKSSLLGRQFLHAFYLELRLIRGGQLHSFTCDLPADLKNVLRCLSMVGEKYK